MAEVRSEAIERVAQGAVAMEAGKEGQVGSLIAEDIGLIGDRIVGEGSRQTGQHHMLPLQGLARGDGFLQIVFDVVAVGADHHQLTALNQILKRVGDPLGSFQVRAHGLQRRQVLGIHPRDFGC